MRIFSKDRRSVSKITNISSWFFRTCVHRIKWLDYYADNRIAISTTQSATANSLRAPRRRRRPSRPTYADFMRATSYDPSVPIWMKVSDEVRRRIFNRMIIVRARVSRVNTPRVRSWNSPCLRSSWLIFSVERSADDRSECEFVNKSGVFYGAGATSRGREPAISRWTM